MQIKLKQKYLIGGRTKNGEYKARTGRRDRIGYAKHAHQGCCLVARYNRLSREGVR